MTFDTNNRLRIDVELQGKNVSLIVDTGGAAGLLSQKFAESVGLDLKRVERYMQGQIVDWSGNPIDKFVRVDDFKIGPFKPRGRWTFFIIDDTGVQRLPVKLPVGTLGLDFLRNFDFEIDIVGKKLSLFETGACNSALAYWAQDWMEMPFSWVGGNKDLGGIEVKVLLDGKEVRAMLDTGAPSSLLDLTTARRLFGLKPGSPGMVKAEDLGTIDDDEAHASYRYEFGSLDLGDVEIKDTEFQLANMGGDGMILGMHHLRHFRMLISPANKRIYFTPASM